MRFATSGPTHSCGTILVWPVTDARSHLYRLVTTTTDVSWEDAESASRSTGEGWHLATITSAAENDFVEAILATDPAAFNCCLFPVPVGRIAAGPWLGARSSRNGSNDWSWVTAEPFNFADWGPLEPFGNGDRISYAEFGGFRRVLSTPHRALRAKHAGGITES